MEQKNLMISKLGKECINANGTVNFGLLALLSPEEDLEIRMLLSKNMDDKIFNEMQKAKKEHKHIIFDYLFLTDCKMLLNADLIIYVDTPIDIRFKRMLSRGKDRFKFTKEQFIAMDKLTKSTIKYFIPHFTINNSDYDSLNIQLEKVVTFIQNKN